MIKMIGLSMVEQSRTSVRAPVKIHTTIVCALYCALCICYNHLRLDYTY